MTNPQNETIFNKLDIPLVYSWVIKRKKLDLNDINEIILNNKEYPYLSNFVRNAIDNPQINHYLFYYADADPENQEDIKNAKNIQDQIQEFDKNLRKIFEKNGVNYNIKIVHKDETIEAIKNLYKKFNSNKEDYEKFIENINKIFNDYDISNFDNSDISYDNNGNILPHEHKIGIKIDSLKILGAFYAQEKENSSTLILDFDVELSKLKLNFNKDSQLPKFTKFYDQGIDINQINFLPFIMERSISEGLIFIPNNDAFQKVFLCFLDNIKINNDIANLGQLMYFFRIFILENKEIREDLMIYLKDIDYKKFFNQLKEFINSYTKESKENDFVIKKIKNLIDPKKESVEDLISLEKKKRFENLENITNAYFDNQDKLKCEEAFIAEFYIHYALDEKIILDYIYGKELNKLEISTGLYDQFYFRNIENNNEYICTAGSSWIISQKKNIQQSNIYQETQNCFIEQKKYTLELEKITEKFLRLSDIDFS